MKNKPFAIIRVTKVKMGTLEPMARHHAREQVTPNADPARLKLNRWLEGVGEPAAHVMGRLDRVRHRKDAVIALEVLMTVSPGFFGDAPEQWQSERIEVFQRKAMAWLGQYFGQHRVASAVLHLDESTPHIHAVVVPTIDGRLRAGHWVNGRAKLQALQSSYAAALAPLGVERGERGSKARHSTLKRHYGQIERLRAKEAQRQRAISQALFFARQLVSLADELLPFVNQAAAEKLTAIRSMEENVRELTRNLFNELVNETLR